MHTDLSEHAFSPESVARESGTPNRREMAWLKWIHRLEARLGFDIDGNETADGYSLDSAFAAFAAGTSVSQHAHVIRRAIVERLEELGFDFQKGVPADWREPRHSTSSLRARLREAHERLGL